LNIPKQEKEATGPHETILNGIRVSHNWSFVLQLRNIPTQDQNAIYSIMLKSTSYIAGIPKP
jgi:hypothetical protein